MAANRRYGGALALGVLLASCGGQSAGDPPASNDAQGGAAHATPAPVCKGNPAPLAAAPCPLGYFYYMDKISGPDPAAGSSCGPGDVGDLLCHQTCNTDADCSDPCRPNCRTLGLFSGGDYNCNGHVRVCGTSTLDQC
jgi:hypothetical protein